MSTSVEFRNVSRKYGAGFFALRNTSIKIAAEEFVSLLGPSGSGKSTMLKLLAGFDEPSSGDILVDGRSILSTPPHLRGIGMVFQNYALFPHMSVADNIAFPLRVRKASDDIVRTRVSDVLGITRLEALADRFPRELSGGQQQRVALARAIVFDPKVLLMDEPLGALDKHLREQLKFEIKRIQQQFRMTVLFVTHDQDEALVLSDRIAIMRDGAIEQLSTPQELYHKPRTKFVATFVGESNLIECINDDGRLHSDGTNFATVPAKSAQNCAVMIRPECISISRQPSPGAMTGRLKETVFLGEATRYIINAGKHEIIAKPRLLQHEQYRPGDEVFLSWKSDDVVVLDG
ncbi:ABC transporter ATP-binding protein [Rhizobium sp. YTU87027]|uniref:ABC transporter ATP-binding protein n=1 Tax=Rhizobium sp. YTU87027 TaxID=3417741 RepID=UPI003D68A03F